MARRRGFAPQKGWLYDLVLWIMSVLVDLFFREVHPRGSWKIPRRGPIILVAAPHANQFVDSLILMRVLRTEAKRRIAWLIAEKSMHRMFIGTLAAAAGAVPVARAMDSVKPAQGKIYLPDAISDPTLLRGIGTDFENGQFQPGGLIVLSQVSGQTPSTEIGEIVGPEELRLRKPFKTREALRQLTGREDIGEDGKFPDDGVRTAPNFEGAKFKVAPHVDQTKVYDAVFEKLNQGGCIGIFPEGGSHDRPDLLPLKAGVAIMALGTLAQNPDCGLKIIPCGMNYFHAHKFRSRAVVEFGNPIEIHEELVEAYKRGERRQAVGSLLETVYQSLVAVTQSSPDYDTLMLAQAARRLYNPTGKKLPLPTVVELNRRLVKGYTKYKDDPRIINLIKGVNDYNRRLLSLGIRDHQVEWGNAKTPKVKIFAILMYRIAKLTVLAVGTLPGLALFWPVFVTTKLISIKKSREALAASTVKLQGRDVMATWKLLVALGIAPLVYVYYGVILTGWTYYNRIDGYYTNRVYPWMVATRYIPDWMPLWMVYIISFALCIMVTFAALRIGEVGMDILKSLPPLFVALNPRSSNTFAQLRERRKKLAEQVTTLINTLGPEVYPDFDANRIVADPFKDGAYQSRLRRDEKDNYEGADPTSPLDFGSPASPRDKSGQDKEHLPPNEHFHHIGSFGFFASRPPSRSRSRSRSSSAGGLTGSAAFPLTAMSSVNTKESFDEVTKRISKAMKERGKERRRKSEDGSWDMASSGAVTPGQEDGKKEQ